MFINTPRVVVMVSCTLAVLGSMSIIMSYMLFPSMRGRSARRMLVMLSVADLGSAVTYLWAAVTGTDGDSPTCTAQALLGVFFPVASFLYTDCVAHFLYRFMKGSRPVSLWLYSAVCWGVPLCLVTAMGVFGGAGYYGDQQTTGGWCWVRKHPAHGSVVLWVLVGGKCVEWLSICVITPAFYILIQAQFGRRLRAVQAAVVTHVTVERTLDRKPFPSQKSEPSFHTLRRRAAAVAPHVQQLSEFNRKLILVPIVFFLGRLSGDVNVVRSLMEPNAKPLYWLGVLQGFFDPSQGFFNGLIFVDWQLWLRMCGRTCQRVCCCRSARGANEYLTSRLRVHDNYASMGTDTDADLHDADLDLASTQTYNSPVVDGNAPRSQ